MAYIVVSVLSLLCISFKVFTISPGMNGGCMKSDGTRFCCSGFYEVNDTCLECIGSIGNNCTNPCPPEWFGPRCSEPCTCPDSECDDVYGCTQENLTTNSKPESSTMSLYMYMLTSKDSTSKDVLLEDGSIRSGPWGSLVHFIKTLKTEHWLIISGVLFFLVFAALCIILVLCRKKRRRKQTNPEHRVYTSNRYTEQTDSEKYCGLNIYTDPVEVNMNACSTLKSAAHGTTEYLHLDSMFEEQTENHEYVSVNASCNTDLSTVNDSKPREDESSEHVYMGI